MILVRGISLGLDEDQQKCYEMGLRRLKIPRSQVLEQRIVKRSVDARKKDHIRFTYTVGYVLKDESQVELSIDVGRTQEKPLVLSREHRLFPSVRWWWALARRECFVPCIWHGRDTVLWCWNGGGGGAADGIHSSVP